MGKGSKTSLEVIEEKLDAVLKKYARDREAAVQEANDRGHAVAPSMLTMAMNFDQLRQLKNRVEGKEVKETKLTIDSMSVDQLRSGELGDRVRAAARELAQQLQLPEIKTVRGLYDYVKNAKITPEMQRVTFNVICAKVYKVLSDYREARGVENENSKQYTGTVFGRTKEEKDQSTHELMEIILGNEGEIDDKKLAVLRNSKLGEQLRTVAQELSSSLKMPEIGTVRGLVQYIQDNKALAQAELGKEDNSKKTI